MLAYATGVSLMVAAFSAWRATRCSGNAWRCVSLIAFSCFGVVIATLLAWIWWRTLTGNGQGDVFEALVITTIAGMFAIFCFRVCRTRSGTVALCTNLAWIWMLLIALYGSALPLSILLVGALISLVLHLLVEKNTCAKVSPVSY
jgi:hypothetical protein